MGFRDAVAGVSECKTCTGCHQSKALGEFGKHKKSKHGVNGKCKICIKIQRSAPKLNVRLCQECESDISHRGKRAKWCEDCSLERNKEGDRRYYKENSEKINASNQRWAEKNREKSREIKRRWVEANPETVKKSRRRSKKKNRDEILVKSKVYRENNRESLRLKNQEYMRRTGRNAQKEWTKRNPLYAKRYYAENREQKISYVADWRKKNPQKTSEARRRSEHRRRARLARVPSGPKPTLGERLSMQGGMCANCKRKDTAIGRLWLKKKFCRMLEA